jgi:hypothetical protein
VCCVLHVGKIQCHSILITFQQQLWDATKKELRHWNSAKACIQYTYTWSLEAHKVYNVKHDYLAFSSVHSPLGALHLAKVFKSNSINEFDGLSLVSFRFCLSSITAKLTFLIERITILWVLLLLLCLIDNI